jgi:hypothetical protein
MGQSAASTGRHRACLGVWVSQVAGIALGIEHVDDVFAGHNPAECHAGRRIMTRPHLSDRRAHRAGYRIRIKRLAVIRPKRSDIGFREAHRPLDHCLEHWGEVAGRGIDDAEHFGGRGLLLQCLTRLDHEACVLDRDDRLRREALQQRDLLIGEWPYLGAVGGDRPKQRAVLPQRNRNPTACPALFDQDAPSGKVCSRADREIVDRYDILSLRYQREWAVGAGRRRIVPVRLGQCGR